MIATSPDVPPTTTAAIPEPRAPLPIDDRAEPRWSTVTRLAFRWSVLYFGLYVLTTQMFTSLFILPSGAVPSPARIPGWQSTVTWAATSVLRFPAPLVRQSGSGDKPYDWTHAFVVLVIASAGTLIWSVLARRRRHHRTVHTWFHLCLRFALGATMVTYGVVKVVPLQMPYPPLWRLVEPFGHFSPMGVLWYSIGASPAYEIFVGSVELAAGLLLFVPRLATLGALVALVASVQIFALNMAYDVPVKLFSLHMILMAAVLLAPELGRLANVLVLNRPAGPSRMPPLVGNRRGARVLLILQCVLGAYIIGVGLHGSTRAWTQFGGGTPKPALYGIWNVEEMSIDGMLRSPLVTDYDRWRRVISQTASALHFQRMDDTFSIYGAKVDASAGTIALTRAGAGAAGALAFTRPAPDRLILEGEMDGRRVRMTLRLVDRNSFLLVNRGFHWIQDYPFNR